MPDHDPVRLDKWLWASRFFKTRTLAGAAVTGGLVHANGARCKPSRAVKIGDELAITKRETTWTVIVRALDDRRRGAPEAQALYEETVASVAAREAAAAAKRADPWTHVLAAGPRPSKRDRREIAKLKRRDR
jgi:ribosome-associated heat shock protein Hsp15